MRGIRRLSVAAGLAVVIGLGFYHNNKDLFGNYASLIPTGSQYYSFFQTNSSSTHSQRKPNKDTITSSDVCSLDSDDLTANKFVPFYLNTTGPSDLCVKYSSSHPKPLTVMRIPGDWARGELNHFIRDGVNKSDCMELVTNILASVWVLDRHRLGDNCEKYRHLLNDRIKLCEDLKNCTSNKGDDAGSTEWKIIHIDYGDHKNLLLCDEEEVLSATKNSSFQPTVNLVWYRRSMVINRTGLGLHTDDIPSKPQPMSGYVRDYSPHMVWHIPYGVRSDMVLAANQILSQELNVSLPNSTKTPLCPVYRPRPNDVRYFWFLPGKCRGECQDSATRFAITRALLELQEQSKHMNLTIKIGKAGLTNELGRFFVDPSYMQEMLDFRIVVVTQRDFHEDHYRLMEAFVAGALVMADPMVIPPKYLVDGQHYVVYYSMEDLKQKVMHYLFDCPKERLRIAYNGWRQAMTRYRSWHMMERIILPKAQQDI